MRDLDSELWSLGLTSGQYVYFDGTNFIGSSPGAGTLSDTLAAGNTTGANDITISDGRVIKLSDGGAYYVNLTAPASVATADKSVLFQDKAGTVALEGTDIVSDSGTGINIALNSTDKLGFFGATAVAQQSAFTAAKTTITYTAPTVEDFALQDVTNTTPWGFADAEELRTLLGVIANLQARVQELETGQENLGLHA